tara:strand:- start:3 stop:185 length:183 start_codon:yes stop_codon:yes gene_type:complete
MPPLAVGDLPAGLLPGQPVARSFVVFVTRVDDFTEIGGGMAKAHDFAERSVRFGSNADCG